MDKYEILKRYFGYTAFRGGQEELIDATLSGRDVLGIMPTGGGKSLCYQIPSLMLSGITLVVSPLISLMKDQVMALRSAGVAAAYINSSLTYEQILRVYDNLLAGEYRILYIAPERLLSDGFAELSDRLPIAMVAVDEAHCVSQWGNDFRPSYLKISAFIDGLRVRPTIVAYTATATEQVREDIIKKLKMRSPLRVVTGFDRPNLYFSVIQPGQKKTALLELIDKRRDKSGIIYCPTRGKVEKICELLKRSGFSATRYHAGLEDTERHKNQDDFVYDRSTVMVATNAFGMGIDKSNVSYVIHYGMPLSLEAYYQEAGRAGRDGESAECILLYSPSDIYTAKQLIASSEENGEISDETREVLRRQSRERLDAMIEYCKTTKCLRGLILDYFGQAHEDECGNCGNCETVFLQKDITVEAQKILSCVRRVYDRYGYYVGVDLIARILHGSEERRIISMGAQGLSTYGIMKDTPISEIKDIINLLIDRGFIDKDRNYGSVFLTESAANVLFRGERIVMEYREVPKKKKKTKNSPAEEAGSVNAGLYERLRDLRYSIAAEQKVPAYIVFTNAALSDMARKLPVTEEEFLEVSGVGKAKAEMYGERFIKEIKSYLEEADE